MASNKANALQSANQTVFGTPVTPPTEILSDFSAFSMTPEWTDAETIKTMDGTFTPATTSRIGYQAASANGEMAAPSYEGINPVLDSLFGKATPVVDADMVKKRTYAAPLNAAPVPQYRTLLWGEMAAGGATAQMNDASVNSITISGEDASAPTISVDWLGSKIVSGPALAALAARTGDVGIIGCHAGDGLYMDDWAAVIGTTKLLASAYSFQLEISANREYRGFLGDCSAKASADSNWSGRLNLSVEVNATTKPYITAMIGATTSQLQKQIRILYSVGTGAAKRSLQIDFTGHCITPPELFQERRNQNAFDLAFEGVYNPTFGNWLKIVTESGLA